MGKVYLKRIQGGDCEDCYCGNKSYLCEKEFNRIEGTPFKCSAENIHYIRIAPTKAKSIIRKQKQKSGESK